MLSSRRVKYLPVWIFYIFIVMVTGIFSFRNISNSNNNSLSLLAHPYHWIILPPKNSSKWSVLPLYHWDECNILCQGKWCLSEHWSSSPNQRDRLMPWLAEWCHDQLGRWMENSGCCVPWIQQGSHNIFVGKLRKCRMDGWTVRWTENWAGCLSELSALWLSTETF